ncbi:MAG TPA: hypothetical protein VLB86_11330 [Gaiellaceae bacterium]|nr:hypothetical protein [Gaiellaceae bacterium]
MQTLPRLAVLVALLLALAGCGGTSGPGSGGGSAETSDTPAVGEQQAGQDAAAPGAKNDPIYIEGGNICVNLPLEQLAAQYGVEATPEAVAEAVGKDYQGADQEKARQGCLDILKGGGN